MSTELGGRSPAGGGAGGGSVNKAAFSLAACELDDSYSLWTTLERCINRRPFPNSITSLNHRAGIAKATPS